jgi:hypothetical protein
MAMPRRRWKFWIARGLIFLALAALIPAWLNGPVGASTTERIVTDWQTGLAIGGFDPVAYFIDAQPMAGSPEHEMRFEQAAWRFRSEGNRAAFADNPDVYLPRYGGYDPVGLARGVTRAGHPALWQIVDQRLYLFYSPQAQAAFAADPEATIAAADGRWPDIVKGLVP